MQVVLILASLLIIGVSADQQPPSVEAVNSQPVVVDHLPVQQPPVSVVSSPVSGVVSSSSSGSVGVQGSPVVSVVEQPLQPASVVSSSSSPAVVEPHHQQHQPPVVEVAPQAAPHFQHHSAGPNYGHYPNSGVSYYAPQAAGLITVVGGNPSQAGSIVNKPISSQSVNAIHHYAAGAPAPAVPVVEQYGQPESASIPANYKPFGAWGLYIGGDPADGYYTNYYKSLSNSVEKQQQQQAGVQPNQVGQVESQVKPALRQAGGFGSSGSYFVSSGPDVYPFDGNQASSYYAPSDLASGAGRFVPAMPPSSDYGTPSASFAGSSSLLSYADSYATKRLQQQQQQQQQQQHQVKEVQQQQQQVVQQPQQSKGYQQRFGYAYSPIVQAAAPVHHPVQPQVVAYPVPVGSQIVGSQPGVDGAFQPYGVHAFTRYAVKPTVVSSASSPVYAPSVASQSSSSAAPVAPHYSFYGYPLSQLHYSAGSISGVSSPSSVGSGSPVVGSPIAHQDHHHEHNHHHHHSQSVPAAIGSVEPIHHHHHHAEPFAAASSDKSETSDNKVVDKQQQ